MTVMAAHHSIWRHPYDSIHASQKPKSKIKFVTFDKSSNISTLWRLEKFLRICSKKDLVEKAQEINVTIPVKKNQERRYKPLGPYQESFLTDRFWEGDRIISQSESLYKSYICQNLNGQ